ncbi:uncharacterized protein BCR38DRAFT_38446 [Pseudomassariella vexata]|uniref:Uncharacterized protein n=1 Tax=Pseudomassariella vexata TaxID=1141098 RepID=A0A1Y2DR29_9PEZI|nr:uncharacterized protein BCR38DRAFT_38446 [Pseudomassariella vexata]ORY61697.1 hypothetical protein BCR38DRAFT_38446 [Pseudomassariella vexata]
MAPESGATESRQPKDILLLFDIEDALDRLFHRYGGVRDFIARCEARGAAQGRQLWELRKPDYLDFLGVSEETAFTAFAWEILGLDVDDEMAVEQDVDDNNTTSSIAPVSTPAMTCPAPEEDIGCDEEMKCDENPAGNAPIDPVDQAVEAPGSAGFSLDTALEDENDARDTTAGPDPHMAMVVAEAIARIEKPMAQPDVDDDDGLRHPTPCANKQSADTRPPVSQPTGALSPSRGLFTIVEEPEDGGHVMFTIEDPRAANYNHSESKKPNEGYRNAPLEGPEAVPDGSGSMPTRNVDNSESASTDSNDTVDEEQEKEIRNANHICDELNCSAKGCASCTSKSEKGKSASKSPNGTGRYPNLQPSNGESGGSSSQPPNGIGRCSNHFHLSNGHNSESSTRGPIDNPQAANSTRAARRELLGPVFSGIERRTVSSIQLESSEPEIAPVRQEVSTHDVSVGAEVVQTIDSEDDFDAEADDMEWLSFACFIGIRVQERVERFRQKYLCMTIKSRGLGDVDNTPRTWWNGLWDPRPSLLGNGTQAVIIMPSGEAENGEAKKLSSFGKCNHVHSVDSYEIQKGDKRR